MNLISVALSVIACGLSVAAVLITRRNWFHLADVERNLAAYYLQLDDTSKAEEHFAFAESYERRAWPFRRHPDG